MSRKRLVSTIALAFLLAACTAHGLPTSTSSGDPPAEVPDDGQPQVQAQR